MAARLEVSDLSVSVGEVSILRNINLTVDPGEIHVLMGPNGAGKSTLGYSLMGKPGYDVTGGKIILDGKDITKESPDKRSLEGLYLSFQSPVEVPGVSLGTFLRNVKSKRGDGLKMFEFRKDLKKAMEGLSMDPSYADRDLNVGFSGGEKKKAEILQMMMLKPKLCILDETDSGLDVDAVRTVSEGIAGYHAGSDAGFIIITHSTRILEGLSVDKVHVMVDGTIVDEGDSSMIDEINRSGFEKYLKDGKDGASKEEKP